VQHQRAGQGEQAQEEQEQQHDEGHAGPDVSAEVAQDAEGESGAGKGVAEEGGNGGHQEAFDEDGELDAALAGLEPEHSEGKGAAAEVAALEGKESGAIAGNPHSDTVPALQLRRSCEERTPEDPPAEVAATAAPSHPEKVSLCT
jgi:hypothetical protein